MVESNTNIGEREMSGPISVAKRVLVVANKNWEVAPLLGVLLEKKSRPKELADPVTFNYIPYPDPDNPQTDPPAIPRAIFKMKKVLSKSQTLSGEEVHVEALVEIWCVQDLMDQRRQTSSSSTFEKMRVLPRAFQGDDPNFVVAFGTAGYVDDTSYNGCVVVGAGAFIHNPFRNTPNPKSPWDDSAVQRPIMPTVSPDFFSPNILSDTLRYEVESRLITPPVNPAKDRIVLAAFNYTAVSGVNVTNYDDYAWTDSETITAFHNEVPKGLIGSVESTHGVIRIQSKAPFVFVSGITDRMGSFNMEVSPRAYSQNFACAHNAGVTTAWMLPRIVDFLCSSYMKPA